MCPISAVVVDLPLVPVIAMTGARPDSGIGADLAREQFDIADDFDACAFSTTSCGAGMRQRHAGREHQRLELVPRPVAPRRDVAPSPSAMRRVFLVVPGIDARAARLQRAHRRHAGARQSEDADVLMREGAGRDHRLTAASRWRGRPAPARPRRSRNGSRWSAPSSRAARNGDGSAPCGRRACRSA